MTDADPEIPIYTDFMLPTLVVLKRLGSSATKDEIDEAVIEEAGLTEDQVAVEFPPEARQTGSKVIHRLAWARTYLKKLGLVDNSTRGVWSLLPEAVPFLEADPQKARTELREGDRAVRKAARVAKAAAAGEAATVEVSDADEEQDESPEVESGEVDWTSQLLGSLKRMAPDAFERLAQRVLREAGFTKVEVMGRTGDGGLDGVGNYRLSLVSFPVFFQCKRYQGSVGSAAVRDFRGAMSGRGEKGLLITTGSFTAEAVKEASRDGAPPVELVDGAELCLLLGQYGLGVQERVVTEVVVDPSYFSSV